MIFTTLDNFYVSKEDLADSPSRKDGISADTERDQRIYGCELIQEAGILLRLPQAVMATGQVLLHRFYCKVSLVAHDVKKTAMACVWLATKLEENPRRMREMLSVFYRLDRRRQGKTTLPPLDVYGPVYEKWKSDVVTLERIMLRAFGFILHVEHPHKFVLNYLVVLEQHDHPESGLLQRAWNLANDSLRSTLCVRFKGEIVACGIIFLAARQLRIPLPEDPAWWDLFNVAKHDLLEVACEVLDLYKLPKAEYAPISKDAQREQRHAAALQQSAASPISGHPTPARSPGTTPVGAVHKVEHVHGASAAPAGDPGSGEGVNSAGQSSSALHQTNGDAKDDHSENSRSSKEAVDHQKQASIRSRSRSRSRSPGPFQPLKKEAAGRNLTGGKHAELSSLILSVQRTGISLKMPDLTRTRTATGTIVVTVIQAGTVIVMRGAIAETLQTASVAGLTDMTLPLLKAGAWICGPITATTRAMLVDGVAALMRT
ncbi:hypothetical protein WJX79_006696 [Trebouxia sp. C0005]